jgi:hypothetical protein
VHLQASDRKLCDVKDETGHSKDSLVQRFAPLLGRALGNVKMPPALTNWQSIERLLFFILPFVKGECFGSSALSPRRSAIGHVI